MARGPNKFESQTIQTVWRRRIEQTTLLSSEVDIVANGTAGATGEHSVSKFVEQGCWMSLTAVVSLK